jgi:hypothetical protein
MLEWNGLHETATLTLDFEPVGIVNDFNNNWLDGKTQKNLMLKNNSQQGFAYFTAKPTTLTDSVFISVENHLVEPYDNPLIPCLSLSTKHFWTINRFDFGEARVEGWFDYSKSNDGDIIETQNDSVTLLYRKDASEAWHEIACTLYPGSTWKQGRFIVEDFQPGEYVLATWDKEALSTGEFEETQPTMQVFPNPARNEVNVSWVGRSDGQVSICDLSGKVLKTQSFTQAQRIAVALDGIAAGYYLLTRKSVDGTPIETEKLIIK